MAKILDGLIAAYSFDGGSLRDYFNVGSPLTNVGSAAAVSGGLLDGAYSFGGYLGSGANSYLKTTDLPYSLRFTGIPASGRTRFFTFWAYANLWTPGDKGILGNWQGTNNQFLFYCFNNQNIVTAVVDNSNNLHFITTPRPTAGAWHFYTTWWDADTLQYGMSIDNGTRVVGVDSLSVKASLDFFSLGNINTGTTPFNGMIDNLTIHDRMLTTAEVTFLYNAGAGQAPAFGHFPANAASYTGRIDPDYYAGLEPPPSLLDWLENK